MNHELLEEKIKGIARRYGSNAQDIEDFEQIARITCWLILENNPNAHIGYLLKSVQYEIIDSIRHKDAKKRKPNKALLSLNREDSEGNTLESLVEVPASSLATEELAEAVISGLKEKFGRSFLTGIKNHRPSIKVAIVRTLIEEVARIPEEEISEKVDYQFFVDHGFGKFLWAFYRNSPYGAVSDAYPDRFFPWQWEKAPNRTWKGRKGYYNSILALNWFARKHGLKSPQDCEKIMLEDFEKDGLSGMIQARFNSSTYLALKTLFPEIQQWELMRTGNNFWSKRRNQSNAVLAYLMDHECIPIIGLSPEEVYDQGLRRFVSRKSMEEYGLRGLLAKYDNKTYLIFRSLFPDQMLPWTISGSKEIWRDNPYEIAAQAIRWLFEKYLQIDKQEIPQYATNGLFWKVGFSGILTNRRLGFNSSSYAVIDNAYPGEFSPDDFRRERTTIIIPELKDMRRSYKTPVRTLEKDKSNT